jgi:hypothetical protein
MWLPSVKLRINHFSLSLFAHEHAVISDLLIFENVVLKCTKLLLLLLLVTIPHQMMKVNYLKHVDKACDCNWKISSQPDLHAISYLTCTSVQNEDFNCIELNLLVSLHQTAHRERARKFLCCCPHLK